MLLNCGAGEDSWESLEHQGNQTGPSQRKSVLNIHWKDWCGSSILWPPDAKSWLIGKDPDAGKDWRQKEKEAAELNRITNSMDMNLSKLQEMVKDREAWLVAVSGVKKKSDMTEWLNQNVLLYVPTLTTVHDYWKTIALTIWTLSAKWCLCFSVHCLGLLQLFFQRASIF